MARRLYCGCCESNIFYLMKFNVDRREWIYPSNRPHANASPDRPSLVNEVFWDTNSNSLVVLSQSFLGAFNVPPQIPYMIRLEKGSRLEKYETLLNGQPSLNSWQQSLGLVRSMDQKTVMTMDLATNQVLSGRDVYGVKKFDFPHNIGPVPGRRFGWSDDTIYYKDPSVLSPGGGFDTSLQNVYMYDSNGVSQGVFNLPIDVDGFGAYPDDLVSVQGGIIWSTRRAYRMDGTPLPDFFAAPISGGGHRWYAMSSDRFVKINGPRFGFPDSFPETEIYDSSGSLVATIPYEIGDIDGINPFQRLGCVHDGEMFGISWGMRDSVNTGLGFTLRGPSWYNFDGNLLHHVDVPFMTELSVPVTSSSLYVTYSHAQWPCNYGYVDGEKWYVFSINVDNGRPGISVFNSSYELQYCHDMFDGDEEWEDAYRGSGSVGSDSVKSVCLDPCGNAYLSCRRRSMN